MNELNAVNDWVHDGLVADTQITARVGSRAYLFALPQSPTYPSILYGLQAATDNQGLGTVRILTRPLFWIRLITKGHPTAADNLVADRLDEIIGKAVTQRAISTASDEYILSARRVQPIQFAERDPTVTGVFYIHTGGLYRIDTFATGRKLITLSDQTSGMTDLIAVA